MSRSGDVQSNVRLSLKYSDAKPVEGCKQWHSVAFASENMTRATMRRKETGGQDRHRETTLRDFWSNLKSVSKFTKLCGPITILTNR